MGTKSLVCLMVIFSAAQPFLFARKAESESLPLLISKFQSPRDLEAKKRLTGDGDPYFRLRVMAN